jgi:hypothetical protein
MRDKESEQRPIRGQVERVWVLSCLISYHKGRNVMSNMRKRRKGRNLKMRKR